MGNLGTEDRVRKIDEFFGAFHALKFGPIRK